MIVNGAAARQGGAIALVEGESDCHTLWQEGFPAVGLPGAGNWNEERDASNLRRHRRQSLSSSNPTKAAKRSKWLAKSKIRDRVKLVRLSGFKDPSALYLDNPPVLPNGGEPPLMLPSHGWMKPNASVRKRRRLRGNNAENWRNAQTFCRKWPSLCGRMAWSARNEL